MRDKLALLVSYFLPMSVKKYAMLDFLNFMREGELAIDSPKSTVIIIKKIK